MLLKSVEMQGFKSFADKIYLDFNPGITAIVGPNGSGKSNISDAIRWVMGEQSIKTLRGSKMEDVIFSGTQSRKPMGFAEVSLTLDNSQGFFHLDYEEITVTRRVYRSGEGEYFINRVGCRLKDIHELFMDTGLGREGYSIIGQGKIDEILSNKSEDRRQIFEEAAGITKYKYRKNEAERKLSHTTENLTRIKDIMAELENQIGPLFEQSEKAKKYLKLRDELKTIEVNLSVVKIDRLKTDIEKISQNLTETDGEIEKIRLSVEESEKIVNELYENISKWDIEMEQCRENEKNIMGSIGDSNSKINVLLTDIGHFRENAKKLDDAVQLYLNKAESARENLETLEKELEIFEENSQKIKTKKANREEEIEKLNMLSETKNLAVEEMKSEVIEISAEISREKERILNSDILKQNFLERKEAAEKELADKSQDYERLSENVTKLEENVSKKAQSIENLERDKERLESELAIKRKERSELSEQSERVNRELSRAISRKNVLEEMEKSFDGFSGSVKAVMKGVNGKMPKSSDIYGPFARLIKVSDKYTTAIDTALGNAGQNIVVKTEDDAKSAIEFLKETKSGRATFLPVTTVKKRNTDVSKVKGMQGYIDLASNLVKTEQRFDGVKSSLLGAIIVADNIDNAIKIAKAVDYKIKIVTLSGEVMQTGGAMTGGSFAKSGGFLSRSLEIESLAKSIEKLKAEDKQISEEADVKADEIRQVGEKLNFDLNEISAINDEYIKVKADFVHYKSFLENITEAKERLESEVAVIDENIEKIRIENQKRSENILKLEKAITDLEEKAAAEQQGFDMVMAQLREANDALVKMSIEENSCDKDIFVQKEKVIAADSAIKEIAESAKRAKSEKAELENKIKEAEAEVQNSKEGITLLEENTKQAKDRLNELTAKKAEAEEQSRKIQKEITGTNDTMFGLSQQKAKLETKKAKLESELESVFERLWEEYEMSYSQAAEAADENADLTDAEKNMASLKSKIKNLGNINIDAIEGYRDIKERYDFMLVQTNDLEKAKADLEKIITEMLAVMKKQFAEQFEIINRNFSKVFSALFGGGLANLTLADPDNLLESGIEIEAQPPGKKLQRLSLLSGGERALTAIALLFAILNVRPTPFCILDEIEAALDDVNVGRYADYLRKYSEKTQFIVVTHRRGTMEAANILYGVTMQERGVSKLLSLNIDEVAK